MVDLITHNQLTYLISQLQEAKDTYRKVLELDSRHSIAIGFLGLAHHLMGEIDEAIVRYHEVIVP
jgi:anaphase-promoting complex subunit 6